MQCSPVVEEESSHPSVECEVPRELILHTDQLMPLLENIFERFEENIWMVQQFRNRRRSKITPQKKPDKPTNKIDLYQPINNLCNFDKNNSSTVDTMSVWIYLN